MTPLQYVQISYKAPKTALAGGSEPWRPGRQEGRANHGLCRDELVAATGFPENTGRKRLPVRSPQAPDFLFEARGAHFTGWYWLTDSHLDAGPQFVGSSLMQGVAPAE